MSLQRKLLILLLVIALVPLLINGLLHRTTLRHISQKLTTETRETLQNNAVKQLQALVKNQSLLLDRDRAFLRQTLATQAREVEHLLAGSTVPTAAELTEVYRFIQQQRPKFFLWQATFLDSGQNTVFPTGAFSLSEAPSWYTASKKKQVSNWQLVFVDAQLQIIAATPIFLPNGDFAGVTAVALKYAQLVSDWELPQPWDEQGRLFIVAIEPENSSRADNLKVLLEIISPAATQIATADPQKLFDTATEASRLDTLIEEMQQKGSGAKILNYDSRDSIWIYAAAAKGEPFPLLIVPRAQATLAARQAADYVEGEFNSGLKLTALLSVVVLFCVVVTAIFRARAVTKPVTQLVRAAQQLAQGDFAAQVSILSNDEFEELGHAFNRIGPQLKERQELKQSLAVAKDIQQLILPLETPQLANFEIAARLDYCDETGGDYYDFIKTESGQWGLVVGDVVGHGVGAALLMASAAGILHAAIANGEENLGVIFSSLNTFLEKDVGDTRFMTLFFALLNPAERRLCWLSAGHGPMFIYRAATGSVEELSATTMPLGVMPDVVFEPVHQETLASGDIFAIGTDGIWKTMNPDGEMFGEERVSQLLKKLCKRSAEEIASEILRAVELFRGEASKEDDLTLIILKTK